jgi:hypothetical protein
MKADTLVLDAADRVETLEVPLTLVKKVEVSRGRKSNIGKGAIVGGLAGVLIGAAGAAFWGDAGISGSDAGAVIVAFAAAGTGIGALIGASGKTDRWEEVPLREIRFGLSSVDNDGIEVSVTLRL